MKKKIYIAGPLFSEAERKFNAELKQTLLPFFDIYLPQDDGGVMAEMVKEGMVPKKASKKVFEAGIQALKDCDLLLIILDGRVIDEGASFELGYVYALGKPAYGLQTDVRRFILSGNNPMIEGALTKVFSNTKELIEWARHYVPK